MQDRECNETYVVLILRLKMPQNKGTSSTIFKGKLYWKEYYLHFLENTWSNSFHSFCTCLSLLVPHCTSARFFFSIRKSDVAIHNFTRSRLSSKLYVHPVPCFSIKNLNENIKDKQFSNATARQDLILDGRLHRLCAGHKRETRSECINVRACA